MPSIRDLRKGLPTQKPATIKSFTKKEAPINVPSYAQGMNEYKAQKQEQIETAIPTTKFMGETVLEYKPLPGQSKKERDAKDKADRLLAKETSETLKKELSEKYNIKIKRSNSPIEFANLVIKIPLEQREQFKKDYDQYTLAEERSNPFRAGAEAGFNILPTNLEKTEGKETVEQAKGYGIGRFVGGAGQQAAFGSVLSAPIESAVGRLLPKATPFITETIKDVAIGTGTQLLEAPFDKPTAGQFAANTALDIALNALFGAVGKGLSSISAIKSAKTVDMVDSVAKEMNITPSDASKVIDDKIDFYVNQFGTSSNKPFEQLQLPAPKTGLDDFTKWRKENFGGAFGKLSEADDVAMKQLYKEDTGIDLLPRFKETPKTVTPGEMSPTQKLNDFRKQEPLQPNTKSQFEDVGLTSERLDIPVGKKSTTTLPPIDTLSKVMTDMPKKSKPGISENFERAYQETFSKVAPFESLAKKTDTPLLRAKATNLNRTTGTVDYNISKAQSDMNGDNIGESIQDIFKTVKETERPEFYDYVLNKHNIARYEQGKPVFGDTVTSDVSANKIINYDASNPQFKEKQQKITKYFNNLLNEWGVKSGLVSEETAKMLNEMYPDYVPTYRAMDIAKSMGGDGNFVSQILKKAKGSEKDILPLDQQMAILTDRTIRNARKNEVMNLLDDVYQSNPEIASRYISDVKKTGTKSQVTDLLDIGKELEQTPTRDSDKFIVTFYKNGEPHQMTVNKTLYEAVTSHEQNSLDAVLNVIKTYGTNPFKSLITQKNPIFFVRNVMRDIPTALIYSNDSLGLVKSTPKAIKEMLSNGKQWQQFQAMGGTRSGLFNYEKGVKLEFDGKKNVLKETGKKISNATELANNMTETLPRFAEYITSINKGESPAIAMMRAAEITTDFARFGNLTKKADAVVPYLNASMQGLDKFFRQMRDKPLQTMAKGGLVVSVPALILDQVNKDNDAYKEMSAFERNNYYHIPIGDKFVRIPRSREVGVLFGTLIEWVNRMSRGQEVTGDEIKEVLKSNFTPVNGFDSNIAKPALNFIDIVTGKNPDAKNYFGANIVSESLQRYSPKEQYDEKTTSLSKALGQYLNVSPKAIDYLMDSYLGVIADVGMPLLAEKKSENPLEKAFIADPVFKSDSVNKFYNNLDKLNQLSADSNRNYDIDSEDITPYEKYRNLLNKASKQLSELRKEQNKTNDQDEVREIRIKMNELSKKAIEQLPTEKELQQQFELYLKNRR